jgi:D-methionine transport system substrate-binding protein
MDNVKKLAEKQGLKIEVVEFSDFVTPNTALAQGEIWANCYQHEPFLKATLKRNLSLIW